MSRKVTAETKRRLPLLQAPDSVDVFSSTLEYTENPADIVADIISNADYGLNLSKAHFIRSELYDLKQVWASRGDTFNGLFDANTTAGAALDAVLRVGRSAKYQALGQFGFIRESQQTIPTQTFHDANISNLSITMIPASDATADVVNVTYRDRSSWQDLKVIGDADGVAGGNIETDINLFGIDNAAQAQREADALAKRNLYRRKKISFDVEMEYLLAKRGAMVALTHELIRAGQTHKLRNYSEVNGIYTLVLSQDIKQDAGVQYYCVLVRFDGTATQPHAITILDDRRVKFDAVIPAEDQQFSVGVEREATTLLVGKYDQIWQPVLITNIRPKDERHATIEGWYDHPSVYVD